MDGFQLVVGDIFDRLERAFELAERRLVERAGAGVALALAATGAGTGGPLMPVPDQEKCRSWAFDFRR